MRCVLKIDTTQKDFIKLGLEKGDKLIGKTKIKAPFRQAEVLLSSIDKLLKKSKIGKNDLGLIRVENKGGSFTSLRIGVVTANALGYGLGIPTRITNDKLQIANLKKYKEDKFDVVMPEYNKKAV